MRERLSAFSSLSRFPPRFHRRRQLRAVSGLHRTPPAPRRDNVGHAAGFFEDVKLPGFVMLPAPLPDGALPADVMADPFTFDPSIFLNLLSPGPNHSSDGIIAFIPCFHNVPSLWDHDKHLACRRRSRAESVTTQCRFLFKLRNSRSYVA